MISEPPGNHLENRYASLMQELERYKGTEKLLTRVLTRLTISASGLSTKLDPMLAELLGLLRQSQAMVTIQGDLEKVSEVLFRAAMDEIDQRKNQAAARTPDSKPVQAKPQKTAEDRFAPLFSFLKSRLESRDEVDLLDKLATRAKQGAYRDDSALFAELDRCLNDILTSRSADTVEDNTDKPGLLTRLFGGTRRGGAEHIDLGSLQKNLLALLDAVEVPITLQAKANRLNDRLRSHLDGDALLRVMQETVEFLANIKVSAQHEQKFIEEFLSELTGKLADLEQQTVKLQVLNKTSEEDAAELHATVSEHVENLRSSAIDATDLAALKSLLTQRLEVVSTYLTAEREEELQRLRATDQQMAYLTERLRDLEDETDQLRSKLRIEHSLAMRDPLTGLPNRLAYDERIHQEEMRFRRFGTPFCLLVWDVDHFKSINDRFGHKSGDKALMTIAEILSASIRETDFVGRFGGEEFVMILAGTRCDNAKNVADGIRAKVENCGFNSHGKPVEITISCGISQFLEHENHEHTFERADQALYRAKHEGRNRCLIAD